MSDISVKPSTEAEKHLFSAFTLGYPLDLNQAGRRKELHGASVRDARRLIRGSVLRDLLLSPVSTLEGHRPQMVVIGADIEGPLDLEFAKIDCPIRLEDCCFDGPVKLSEAELRSVSLRDSSAERGIQAGHVRITGDFILDRVHVIGPLELGGAHLEDDLHLTGTRIDYPRSAQVSSDSTPTASSVNSSKGNDTSAILDLVGIEVKGRILADDLTVQGDVMMDGASVGGTVTLKRLHVSGQVSLIDAHMQSLVLRNARIISSRSALVMDRLQCNGSLFCDGKIRLIGGIHAIGMKVGATLYLGKGMIRAPGRGSSKQWAVYLQRARIGDDITCRGGFHSCGVFDISNAQIGGSLDLCGATMKPTRGGKLSFIAGRAHIGGNVKCTDWFTCAGVMGLVNAKIDGWLEIDEKSDRHEALVASGLHVGRHASLETTGWIDLRGAEFAGDLTIKLTKLSASGHEPTADLSALSAHVLKLDGRQQGCLDLTRASVQLLLDSPAEWRQNERLPAWIPLRLVKHIRFLKHRLDSQESAANESPVVLDGLVYEQIGSVGTVENPSDRLDWLAAGTQWLRDASDTEIAGGEMRRPYYRARFTPQPYQQLTAVYRRNGRDSDARDVLHTMYCRHNSVMNRSRYVIRAWNSIQNWAIGYGYRPKRAFLWIVLLATSTTVWFALFDNKAKMGPVQAAIASLGLALPGSGLEKVEHFPEMSVAGHLFALGLVLAGLVLGATVIAAIGRAINN